MRHNNLYLLAAVSTIASMLTACGGSSSGGTAPTGPTTLDTGFVVPGQPAVSGTFKYFGYVDIDIDGNQQQVDRDTNFFAMTVPQDTNVFTTIPPATNQCRLRITPSIPTDSAAIGFPTETFTLANAGETMTLTGPDGTYVSTAFTDDRLDFAPFPAPDDLTLDIPGMEFPAFTNVDVPALILPTGFQLSTGNELQVGTEFTWDIANSEDGTLHLIVNAFSTNSQFVSLKCRMDDTGSFTLPANVENALISSLGADFSLTGAEIDKKAVNIVTAGDALLVVTRKRKFN